MQIYVPMFNKSKALYPTQNATRLKNAFICLWKCM